VDEATDEACDVLEAEAWRRAVDGVDRPIFQRGEQVGVERVYSDNLMVQLLKAHRPEKYRERTENIQRGQTEIRVAGLSPERAREEVADRLTKLLRNGK
jgi:hypothetical protein